MVRTSLCRSSRLSKVWLVCVHNEYSIKKKKKKSEKKKITKRHHSIMHTCLSTELNEKRSAHGSCVIRLHFPCCTALASFRYCHFADVRIAQQHLSRAAVQKCTEIRILGHFHPLSVCHEGV